MVDVNKSTETTKLRKSQKIYGSDDNSNWSQDIVVSPRPNGKTRAGRGSATDPQSVYVRKRRERIKERLRILQSLVPNGTKVDISTMLEEAVQYVKFLQVQIIKIQLLVDLNHRKTPQIVEVVEDNNVLCFDRCFCLFEDTSFMSCF